jgi:hypothetical protein
VLQYFFIGRIGRWEGRRKTLIAIGGICSIPKKGVIEGDFFGATENLVSEKSLPGLNRSHKEATGPGQEGIGNSREASETFSGSISRIGD